MTSKPYLIRISSQKGGVGKTTVAVNLGVALAMSQYKVLVVDSDMSNPSVGFHLGLEDVNIGTEDVIRKKVSLKKAVVVHAPSSLSVLPGTLTTRSYIPSASTLTEFFAMLANESYDFIIIDTAPGLLQPETLSKDLSGYVSEALIITTPELSACTSSIRLAKEFDKVSIRHSLAINRFRNRNYEISPREINELYGNPAIGMIPEDETVPISVAQHIPAYLLNSKSKFAIAIGDTASMYVSKAGLIPKIPGRSNKKGGIFRRIWNFFFG